jgi:hypothetical protein
VSTIAGTLLEFPDEKFPNAPGHSFKRSRAAVDRASIYPQTILNEFAPAVMPPRPTLPDVVRNPRR